jgi:hypothetical protein
VTAIESREYFERQRRARELARTEGRDALVAWSRGALLRDHYAEVF